MTTENEKAGAPWREGQPASRLNDDAKDDKPSASASQFRTIRRCFLSDVAGRLLTAAIAAAAGVGDEARVNELLRAKDRLNRRRR